MTATENTPNRLEVKAAYRREMERTAALSALEGSTLYTGSNIPKKWSRVAWLVRDGLAFPQFRQHFWNSTPGRRDTLTSLRPEPITQQDGAINIGGSKASHVIA